MLKIYIYRVSQKFVPLISCTIIFDQNLFLHEISRRCLFLYREHMFIISVTGMPFFFFFFSHSVAVAAWCGTRRVDPQMIHFELFYHLGHRSQLNPKQYLFTFGSWKKNIYFGHSSTKDNHPGPLLQQGFCTSSEIWHELSVTWQIKWRLFF